MRQFSRKRQATVCLALLILLAGIGSATTAPTKTQHSSTASAHKSSSHTSTAHHSSKHSTKTASKSHGQRTIDQERTRQIQEALIRQHYLTGEPSGSWDAATKDAMTRFQAENGWQTKVTPDSRALIKLGLGPDNKGLLNPQTAAIASPASLSSSDLDGIPGGGTSQQK